MLFKEALKRLACPVCKHYPLELRSSTSSTPIFEGEMMCAPCGMIYPISHGVPNFTPQIALDRKEKWGSWRRRLRQFDRRAVGWTKEDAQERIPIMEDLFHHFHHFKGSLLDIGCGDGEVRLFLSPEAEYWGVDPEDWVTTPKHTFEKETLFPGIKKSFPLFLGIGEYLPFRDETFDHVLIFASLDHVHSPRDVLRESLRVLKRKGYIVVHLQLGDPEYQIPRSAVRRLRSTLQRGISKLPKGDFTGFAKGILHTLFDKPDLSFTRKEIEKLFGNFFLDTEIEVLSAGDAFVKAMKP